MKSQLRALAQAVSPKLLDRYRSHRLRRYFSRQYSSLQEEAYGVLFGHGLPKILSGPFTGMPYLDEIVWGPITPKWIGCYEAELHNIVERILSDGYTQIVNVGCAEGYYAVGFAWRLPGIKVIAFDSDPVARQQASRLAALAGVADRITISGYCTAPILNRLASQQTVLTVDIEGSEVELLNPERVRNLSRVSILVEVHSSPPLDSDAVALTLRQRFEASHHLYWFQSENRNSLINQYKSFWSGKIGAERFVQYLDEGRSEPQRWLWAESKRGSTSLP
jgi:hypothetical protein